MSNSPRQDGYQVVDQTHSIPPSILQKVRQQAQGTTNGLKKSNTNVKLPPLSLLTTSQGGNSSAGVWHHNAQRQKLKHLTDNTACVCGAGRDISFLYDSTSEQKQVSEESVPQSLIPEEYHIVKHPGVLGLEFNEDTYAVNPENHERHLTTFPSLKPSGRQEVLALKNTMLQMTEREGLRNKVINTELTGPTQMHNLVKLIQKEQEIYNICFHELIRQVSVGCIERGALLAEIRDCYANLLNRIPFQVKSLHDEVLAQRTLDRKLTSEIGRFRDLMSSLTSELSELKDQGEMAGDEIKETKDELSMAISDSEKNANLLVEYCELYELQRKRLEDHIVLLTQEKDRWEQTCYSLALKVAEKRQLKTIQQIQLSGKAWEKLGTHFTILIVDKDTKELSVMQEEVHQWRKDVTVFTRALLRVEEKLALNLRIVEEDMSCWLKNLNKTGDMSKEGDEQSSNVNLTHYDKAFCNSLWKAILSWLQTLNELSEMFSGEVLLERQEHLQEIELSMKRWSEMALSVIQHHITPGPVETIAEHSNESQEKLEGGVAVGEEKSQEKLVHSAEGLNSLVADVNTFIKDLSVRTSGENGVAVGFVHLITPMEAWDTKLNLIITSDSKQLTSSDVARLITQIETWLQTVHSMRDKVSVSSNEDNAETNNSASVDYITQSVYKWCSLFARAIQTEDGQVIEQVAQTHSSLISWVADVLLYLTSSDNEDDSEEAPPISSPGTATSTTLAHVCDLKSSCMGLSEQLNRFTKEIITSCNLVFEDMLNNKSSSETNLEVDTEREEIQVLQDESANWIRLASVLVDTCITEERRRQREMERKRAELEAEEKRKRVELEAEKERKRKVEEEMRGDGTESGDGSIDRDEEEDSVTSSEEGYSPSQKEELLRTIMTIGGDDNVQEIDNIVQNQGIISEGVSSVPLRELGLSSEEELPEGRGALLKDAEKLLLALDKLKVKLAEEETVSGSERERAEKAEAKVKQMEAELSMVTAELEQAKKDLNEQMSMNTKNRKTSKGQKSKERKR